MGMNSHYLPFQRGIIYGPIQSRRLGPSLGINLLPANRKLCTFNCVYCQYGPEVPHSLLVNNRESIELPTLSEVEKALRSALCEHPDVNYITFSGNGEPTMHPQFPEIVDLTTRIRDESGIAARTAILTNSTTITSPKIRDALMRLDSPFMKLDAGSDDLFTRINRPHPDIRFESIVEELKRFDHPNLMMQAIFFAGKPTNVEDQDVEQWAATVKNIGPREVHIYTTERPVARMSVHPVERSVLENLALRATRVSGVPVRVF